MSQEPLREVAGRELRAIDRRSLFWIDLAVATLHGSNAAQTIDWSEVDWPALRQTVDGWLDGLSPDITQPAEFDQLLGEDLGLRLIAMPRSAGARGYKRLPSFKLSAPQPLPPLRFEDGDTAALEALPIEAVQQLASGHRRLAIELPSHRAAWTMLHQTMSALGYSNTSEMPSIEIEVHAAMLSLIDDVPSGLGNFDEGWRAVHGLDVPFDPPPEQRDD